MEQTNFKMEDNENTIMKSWLSTGHIVRLESKNGAEKQRNRNIVIQIYQRYKGKMTFEKLWGKHGR